MPCVMCQLTYVAADRMAFDATKRLYAMNAYIEKSVAPIADASSLQHLARTAHAQSVSTFTKTGCQT